MKRRAFALTVAIVGGLVAAGDAMAHDTWLLPRSMRTPVGRAVVLSLTSGEAFPADDFAIDPARVARASVRLAGHVDDLTSRRPAPQALHFLWTPRMTGVAGIAVELRPRTLTLAPDKIEEYFADINASKALRAEWKNMPSPKQWRESYTKHAASFVLVGEPRADSSWKEPLGMDFEITPEVNPTTLRQSFVGSLGQYIDSLLDWFRYMEGNYSPGGLGIETQAERLQKFIEHGEDAHTSP